jgi:hypothetical protein
MAIDLIIDIDHPHPPQLLFLVQATPSKEGGTLSLHKYPRSVILEIQQCLRLDKPLI